MIGGISRLLILEIGKPPSYCRCSGLKELVCLSLLIPKVNRYDEEMRNEAV